MLFSELLYVSSDGRNDVGTEWKLGYYDVRRAEDVESACPVGRMLGKRKSFDDVTVKMTLGGALSDAIVEFPEEFARRLRRHCYGMRAMRRGTCGAARAKINFSTS